MGTRLRARRHDRCFGQIRISACGERYRGRDAWLCAVAADFLACRSLPPGVRSIVTNPPYALAEQFLRRALDLTRPAKGMVAMLFRNEYDSASGRRDLFERPPFAAKLVLTRRPRWVDALQQNSASPRHDFAWYLWDHYHSGPATIGWLP
jgi:hypothetical protein